MAPQSEKSGLPPGTVVYIGKKKVKRVLVEVIDYTDKTFQSHRITKVEECKRYAKKRSITWINVVGLHDTEIIQEIGKFFGIHPLVQEDIVNPNQRPKVENFPSHLFIVLKMLQNYPGQKYLNTEQVSLVFGKGFVISFQERKRDVFDQIRERLEQKKGRLRRLGADYLAYALIDSVVDHYFSLLESMGEELEDLESHLVERAKPKEIHRLHAIKRNLIHLRKSIWPLRELVNGLYREDSGLIKKDTKLYLRDVYDHTIQVIDTVESFRDIASGMLEVYLSTMSNRMNEVMKVLTIYATIFIPLTFITGVYGMNFDYMPELGWKWSYPLLWGVFVLISFLMLWYFRRKKWL